MNLTFKGDKSKITPTISVLMPMYNAEHYIEEAVYSILNQSFTDFEFIIIDDCSTDNTYKIVEGISDPRIRLYKNDKNLKISKTLNKGLELARGDYLARMDADDISRPHRLQKQYDFLEQNTDIDLCGTGVHCFGIETYDLLRPELHDDIKDYSLYGTCFSHPSFMTRRKVYKNMRYDEAYAGIEDFVLFSDLVQKYKSYNLQETLLDYRISGNQTSFQKGKNKLVEIRPFQRRLYFDVFANNLRRLYSSNNPFRGDTKEMEHFFTGKKMLPIKSDFLIEFENYFNYINRNKEQGAYSTMVIQNIFISRILDSLRFTYNNDGSLKFLFDFKSVILSLKNNKRKLFGEVIKIIFFRLKHSF